MGVNKDSYLILDTLPSEYEPASRSVSSNLTQPNLVGVNKDSYLILDTLLSEYDSRVKVCIL